MTRDIVLVSVYITTCNRLEILKKALNSVQEQTYPNIEIIVSDDASNDGTEYFMREYVKNHNNCIYLRNEEQGGACLARNNAISRASGQFITGLDDDDLFTSDRIEYFLDNWNDRYSFICANFTDRYSDGSENFFKNTSYPQVLKYTDLFDENLATNQVFTKTAYLRAIGGFNLKVRRLQDWDTWLRLSYNRGEFLFLPKSTYIMMHNHSPNFQRVSKSYPIENALLDLYNNNEKIFGVSYTKKVLYAKYLKKELKFLDSIHWAILDKNLFNVVRYFKSRFR